ncbi:dTMP kinase [Candidatus Bathyarchaeota archaeon]|nr:dTMP kinase [Candidatus Bathyarchaeota archaeon]
MRKNRFYGKLICLEGIDQAGKKSQTCILAEKLRQANYSVEVIAFPDYTTPLGREIQEYLKGIRLFNPQVRQMLYVANRLERLEDIIHWLKTGRIIIADRYTPSGLAYGLANGLNLKWMISLEHSLPSADLVIVLDISPETAFQRRELKGDIYEQDEDFLRRVRTAYLKLAKKFGWVIINGENPIEIVSEQVWKVVAKKLRIKG